AIAIVTPEGQVRSVLQDATLHGALADAVRGKEPGAEFIAASAPLGAGGRLITVRRRPPDEHLSRIVAGSETYEQLRERQR
ncbi:hypothetical protein KK472_29320, partial [Klebsiella pneumoniae]|uniref:hypothetical protein n=1 Tax=Klebsiella pneumoniae TaxID=573 RepID=UPI001BE00EBC